MPFAHVNRDQPAGGRAPLLCPDCRRYVGRKGSWCTACGRALDDGAPPLEILLEDGTRVALTTTLTIGRRSTSSVRLRDPCVSRLHARVLAARPDQGPVLEDAGSTYGTWLDGQRLSQPAALHEGVTIRVGDSEMRVERRRDPAGAGRTVVVPPDPSAGNPAGGAPAQRSAGTSRPQVRAGWALKRMEAGDGDHRWVLRDLDGATVLRIGDAEAHLFRLLDGRRSLVELIEESERRNGPVGLAVLSGLLATLADHGLLAGVEPSRISQTGWLNRLLTPRTFCLRSADRLFDLAYRAGGWTLLTWPGLIALATIAIAGAAALTSVVVRDTATPFVVSTSLGLGALVFILGRLFVVAMHELAHGLALVALGRTPGRCGVKFVAGFPYAFVDTTAVLLEPRRRRIAVSGAGPAADLTIGGAFALACLLTSRGIAHDICFQLSLISYLGALVNLNPILDRDGYHILVDWLRVPNLRRHARQCLAAGGARSDIRPTRAVLSYAAATVVWASVVAGFVVFLSLRYLDELMSIVPAAAGWGVLIAAWALALLPVLATLSRPLSRLARGPLGPAQ